MAFAAHLAVADAAALAHLGSRVRYQPASLPYVDVRGIFDAAYQRVELGQAGVTSSGPAVFLRLADLPADPDDHDLPTVIVDGVEYRVREVRKDGLGGVLLMLHEAC